MNVPLPQIQEKPKVCQYLRTKTAFGTLVDEEDGELMDWTTNGSTTAVYWCLRTMETAGEDDGYVHPTTCVKGRGCYRIDE